MQIGFASSLINKLMVCRPSHRAELDVQRDFRGDEEKPGCPGHKSCLRFPLHVVRHVAGDEPFNPVVFPPKDYYYLSVKALYTVGYSTSLVSLTTAMVILCRFR